MGSDLWLEWVGYELIYWLVNIGGFLAGIDLIVSWWGLNFGWAGV